MKHSLFFSVLAAALLGCVAAHAETFYASEYSGGGIGIGSDSSVTDYDTLKVNQSLSLTRRRRK